MIRKVTLILLIVFSFTTFIYSSVFNWTPYLKNSDDYIFSNHLVSGKDVALNAFKSCIQDDMIVQREAEKVCLKYKRTIYRRGNKPKRKCVEWGYKYNLSTPITYYEERCVAWIGKRKKRCIRYANVKVTVPTEISIDVYEKVKNKFRKMNFLNDVNKRFLFTETYNIPVCKK